MAKKIGDNNDRILALAKILFEESDKKHMFSNEDIQNRLKEQGISSHRQTITGDIEALIKYGIDIEIDKSGRAFKYYIDDRHFTLSEIQVLVDCISSAGLFTNKKTKEFVEKLAFFTSNYNKETIKNNYITDSIYNKNNEDIWTILSLVNKAINERKQLAFFYFKYDLDNKKVLKNNGKRRYVSPYKLYWNKGNYYIIGWGYRNNAWGEVLYRVDRIEGTPYVVDTPKFVPRRKDFNIKQFVEESFDMMHTDPVEMELVCNNALIDEVIDKFGLKAPKKANDANSFRVTINVGPNDILFGWIFSKRGMVRIAKPVRIKNMYEKRVREELKRLER